MNKLLVILGPTATGKTDLALSLARKFNGELVSCDSRQVYAGLDIGTGKLPSGNWKLETGSWRKSKGFWEIDGIKVWMYDVISPKKQYTVAHYVKDANKVIDDIGGRNKLPIIVGGTGLYLKALLEGLLNLAVPVDYPLRKKLEKLSKEQLQFKLKEISKDKWRSLSESDRQNLRRLVRSIELSLSSLRAQRSNLDMRLPRYFVPRNDVLRIGLTAAREVLYQRVDDSVLSRIKQGMIEEATRLHKEGLSFKRMRQLGLEYGVLADYLDGKIQSEQELIKLMQNKVHSFVRRQLTWFKREKDIVWFDILNEEYPSNVEKMIAKWYHQT